jgi:hypothetical protein
MINISPSAFATLDHLDRVVGADPTNVSALNGTENGVSARVILSVDHENRHLNAVE